MAFMTRLHPGNEARTLKCQNSAVTGLPDERTTTVGFPVATIARTSASCAPTRSRLSMSTCSPVVAFRPAQSSFWSRDQVPTTTTAMRAGASGYVRVSATITDSATIVP